MTVAIILQATIDCGGFKDPETSTPYFTHYKFPTNTSFQSWVTWLKENKIPHVNHGNITEIDANYLDSLST